MRETRILCETVVVNAAGKLLLLKRSDSDKRRPGQWDVPGGHCEPGEKLETAAARELQEEAGITVDPAAMELKYAVTGRRGEISAVWLFFTVTTDIAETAVVLSDEHSEFCWVSPSETTDLLEYDLQQDALRYLLDHDLIERP